MRYHDKSFCPGEYNWHCAAFALGKGEIFPEKHGPGNGGLKDVETCCIVFGKMQVDKHM